MLLSLRVTSTSLGLILAFGLIRTITAGATTDAGRVLDPEIRLNHWYSHNESIWLQYGDDHVVVYFDSGVPKSASWPFPALSEAWKYVKETYGEFRADPHLYVILHSQESECIATGTKRSMIDCGSGTDGHGHGHGHGHGISWETDNAFNFERLLSNLGEVVQEGAKGMFNTPDLFICEFAMVDIVFYDIYLRLRGRGSSPKHKSDVAMWKQKTESKSVKNLYWFRDWFLPIYETYGGKRVLNEFYSLLDSYWRKRPTHFYEQLNEGEFVHFWSGAAGADLTELARKNFNWAEGAQMQLARAREDYPDLKYSYSIGQGNGGGETDTDREESNESGLEPDPDSHGINTSITSQTSLSSASAPQQSFGMGVHGGIG